MTEWQPITTAPKDGTSIILYRNAALATEDGQVLDVDENRMTMVGEWDNELGAFVVKLGGIVTLKGVMEVALRSALVCEWTHWMPLPPPPEEE